jgi:hypothetical protein
MKTNLHRVMFLAAATLVATGTVWAQSPVNANVPFDFKVGIAKLPAGEYRLSDVSSGAASTLLIRSTDNRNGALAVAQGRISTARDLNPHLMFRCIGGSCTLVEMWNGATGYRWNEPKRDKKEPADSRLAVIYLNKPAAAE